MANSTMENDKKISWSKWRDPLKAAWDKHKNKHEHDSNDLDELDQYSGPVIQTDFGIIPLNEASLPSSIFKFWRADTNFPLTNQHNIILRNTLGVETLDYYTPYRFRVGVATLFNDEDVKGRIEKALLESFQKPVLTDDKKYNMLYKQFKFFIVISNEKNWVFAGNSKEEAENKLKKFVENGGSYQEIFKSWEHNTEELFNKGK